MDTYGDIHPEWKQYSKKMGWQLKLLKGKRNIMFIVPFEGSFLVYFIFGDKAVKQVVESDLPTKIKTELQNAKKYMEGRGIEITVLGEDTAFLAASGDYSLDLEDGRTLTGKFTYTIVYSKVNGNWKIIHANM